MCNQIVRREGLDALSNDELYKLLNYRELRLKLSEYKECSFLAKALSNGWLVSDIEMLRTVYHTVQNVPEGDFRPSGEKILGQFASQKMDTLIDRFEMMELTNRYLAQLSFQHGEFKQARILASNRHNKGMNSCTRFWRSAQSWAPRQACGI